MSFDSKRGDCSKMNDCHKAFKVNDSIYCKFTICFKLIEIKAAALINDNYGQFRMRNVSSV